MFQMSFSATHITSRTMVRAVLTLPPGISDLNFTTGQNHTPTVASVQPHRHGPPWVASGLVLAVALSFLVCFLPGACLAVNTCPQWMRCGRQISPSPRLLADRHGQSVRQPFGATLQRRGLVRNGMVKFVGTSVAGGLALGLALTLGL